MERPGRRHRLFYGAHRVEGEFGEFDEYEIQHDHGDQHRIERRR
jgi:hypothetical protein